jgi:hypothetical protein
MQNHPLIKKNGNVYTSYISSITSNIIHRYDAFLMEIDVANTLALRNQGVVNTGMERWMDQKTTEYNHSLLILQKGYKMVKYINEQYY